jgi:nicotinate-nucleotide adenylyltransferase
MRIGLFGGSFDPAHSGHLHVAHTAMKTLGLDAVWWLATPQNPLKPKSGALKTRMKSARALIRGRRMVVTDIESRMGVRYSADTIAALVKRYPGVRFVWVMGGDNLGGFHRWRRWRAIFKALPIAIVARGHSGARAQSGPAFARFRAARRTPGKAFATAKPPAWTYVRGPLDPTSSTALRARR